MSSERSKEKLGRMLVIGGAEDPDDDDLCILPHLVEMAGGKRARVLVCSSPSEDPEATARDYIKVFKKIGVADAIAAPITSRRQADEDESVAAVERATCILFSGGDQLRLVGLIAGSRFGECVRNRLMNDGLVVAGTSAGAAAMSSTMVIGGPNHGTIRRADVEVAPGLGYFSDTIIDTHFNQRGRVSRLLTLLAQNPQVLGVGIDENTAIEVTPGAHFQVIGEGAVLIADGRVTHTNAADVGEDEVIALTDSKIHILPKGYGFDLNGKRPRIPDNGKGKGRGKDPKDS